MATSVGAWIRELRWKMDKARISDLSKFQFNCSSGLWTSQFVYFSVFFIYLVYFSSIFNVLYIYSTETCLVTGYFSSHLAIYHSKNIRPQVRLGLIEYNLYTISMISKSELFFNRQLAANSHLDINNLFWFTFLWHQHTNFQQSLVFKFCENRQKQGINFDKINWLTLLFQ